MSLIDNLESKARNEELLRQFGYVTSIYPITIPGLLGLIFITLKLCKVIDWSWWIVTIPYWGILALLIAILAILWMSIAIYYCIAALFYHEPIKPKVKPEDELKDRR